MTKKEILKENLLAVDTTHFKEGHYQAIEMAMEEYAKLNKLKYNALKDYASFCIKNNVLLKVDVVNSITCCDNIEALNLIIKSIALSSLIKIDLLLM